MDKTSAAGTRVSVLIIDAEPQIQRLLTTAIEASGCRITLAATGKEGLSQLTQRRWDLIVLDLALPDLDGMLVLKQLREWSRAPVLILSAHDGETARVEALDGGADDFIAKPCNTAEFLARMRAALRRMDRGPTRESVNRFGHVEVDLARRRVTRKGQLVKLTVTEYALHRLFVQHAGNVLTHGQILREIWGAGHEGDTQYLRVYMRHLREKLEPDIAAPPLFLTEPGVGYRLIDPENEFK